MDKTLAPGLSLREAIHEGVRQGFFSFYTLLKIMTPVYLAIALMKELGIVEWLAAFFAPAMEYFGLPGEAALVIVSGWTVNLYGAIAVLAGLSFSARQVTVLAVILGISHSLIMETAIVSRMKGRPWLILILRLVLGLAAGLVMNLILPVVI